MATERLALAAGTIGILVLLAAPGLSAKRQPCPGGRFLAQGPALVFYEVTPQSDAVVITGTQLSVGTVCAPVSAKLKARKKFTTVIGKWRSCSGLIGRVSLKARIDAATCNTMTGRFKAGKSSLRARFTAVRSVCGDGLLDSRGGELCDDGNQENGDGCDVNCTLSACGNGIVGPDEECDDGNELGGDGCTPSCVVEYCGDGVINNRLEECEPPGTGACRDDCTMRVSLCGDGFVTRPETCDDGNNSDGDGCSSTCELEDTDGDGVPDDTDQCTDTPTKVEVDRVGCSLEQFCSQIDATTRFGKRVCRNSDWRNDEPLMGTRDRDCTVGRGAGGTDDDRCVPNLE